MFIPKTKFYKEIFIINFKVGHNIGKLRTICINLISYSCICVKRGKVTNSNLYARFNVKEFLTVGGIYS